MSTDTLLPQPADHTGDAVVAVRTLCDFAARQGDLDLRMTPSPTGAEGVAGHAEVTARRPAHYQREVSLCSQWRGLRVQGRADGWDPQAQRVEEIKTHRGSVGQIAPDRQALHWAQAEVYGWMLCEQLGLSHIRLALVYHDIDSGHEQVFERVAQATALQARFEALCERYLAWAAQELLHRRARDQALATLGFAFPAFRRGQRELAAAVYRTHRDGGVLLAQAPTGIGKTMATVFAALRAMPGQGTDKLFYLTPRTTGRQLALDALQRLTRQHGATGTFPLRVIERVARDKACEHPQAACHGDACPLARGFFDKLPGARAAAVQAAWLDRTALREIALAHQVCPYHLGQELLRWSDVAVGDVNHFFDLGAHWHALSLDNGWRVDLLVDEAHNLVDRARAMYSARLDPAHFQAVRAEAPAALAAALDALHRQWNALAREAAAPPAQPPAAFIHSLQRACGAIGEHLAQHPGEPAAAVLQRWYLDALHVLRVAALFDSHSVFELEAPASAGPRRRPGSRQPVLQIRNLWPGPLLLPRWAAAHAATLFSATLEPVAYFQDLLSLPAQARHIELPSPFEAAQLVVHVASDISTRYADRAASLQPLAALMAAQFQRAPGNYLAFFSSFDYLEQAQRQMLADHARIPVWSQTRGMSEAARDAFLARFTEAGQGIGFAVLGGAFGEGIDLPGNRLIGAFIATLGMPQVNTHNERLKALLQARFGRGHDYAYLYPGLQKVVQAAGRIIRSETDQGTLWLLDDRYARAAVRQWLPRSWQVRSAALRGTGPAGGEPSVAAPAPAATPASASP